MIEGVKNLFGYGKKEQSKQKVHLPKFFSVQIMQNGNKNILLHKNYQLKKDDQYFEEIEFYLLLANEKKSINAGKIQNKFDLQYFPSFQFALAESKMDDEKCTICLSEFQIKSGQDLSDQLMKENDDDIYLLKCSHMFHLGCLNNLIGQKDWAKCPVCSTIFGVMKGDQPDGTMNVTFDKFANIQGHGKGVITIHYSMNRGVRNGKAFAGTSRTAYLPDNKEGQQVLELLREAFDRRLIFTVGRSVTSGLDNQTVWNGIHHKTSIHGGVGSFGYPDETYLTRVKQELAAKGITLDSIKQQKI